MRMSTFISGLAIVFAMSAIAAATEPVDWSGWYAGVFGGYLDGKLTSNDPAHFETTGEFDDNSPLAGIQLGVQSLRGNGWVLGGELVVPLYIDKGTAVDTYFFPDESPRVTYEADYRWGVLVGGKLGKPAGKALPYGFVAIGLAGADGKTINLDENNVYTPGAEQSASATHLVYQLGAGADLAVSETAFAGVRVVIFNSNQKQYEMPWNEGEKNDFGMNSVLVQAGAGYRF